MATEQDDYAYNARELAKAAPKRDMYESCALKMRGPVGESRWINISDEQYHRVVHAVTTPPGITYAVQPSEITRLTAPMWEACSLTCPAMIGAYCPKFAHKHNGSLIRCPAWSAKFVDAASEVVYGWMLEAMQDDEAGNASERDAWFGLFNNDDPTTFDGPMGAGVILCVTSGGLVQATRFNDTEELTRDWAKITAEYADDDEDGDEYDEPTDADEEPGMIR